MMTCVFSVIVATIVTSVSSPPVNAPAVGSINRAGCPVAAGNGDATAAALWGCLILEPNSLPNEVVCGPQESRA